MGNETRQVGSSDSLKRQQKHNFHIKHKHYAKFQAMVTKVYGYYMRGAVAVDEMICMIFSVRS